MRVIVMCLALIAASARAEEVNASTEAPGEAAAAEPGEAAAAASGEAAAAAPSEAPVANASAQPAPVTIDFSKEVKAAPKSAKDAAMEEVGASALQRGERAPEPVPDPEEPSIREPGLIPGVQFGPRIALLNVPSPSVGVEVKIHKMFGVSFDYGIFPELTFGDVSFDISSWSVGAKIYPWKGAFFAGVVLGRYEFEARKNITVNGISALGRAKFSSTFLAPQIGWRTIANCGFFTGVDLGWAFPLSFDSSLELPTGGSSSQLEDVKNNADRYANSGIPLLGAMSVGWLF